MVSVGIQERKWGFRNGAVIQPTVLPAYQPGAHGAGLRVRKGGVAGPDQARTPSSACCQVALPGAAGRLPGWPLASGLPQGLSPEVTYTGRKHWKSSVLRALYNPLVKRDNTFWFLITNHMELFCPGYNEEVSRNTHKARQAKNLVKLDGLIAKNTTKTWSSKEI